MDEQGALGDAWWEMAKAKGLVAVESRGWDHNHPTVSPVIQHAQQSGDFLSINTFSDDDTHVRASRQFIASKRVRRPQLFAYPWTQASDFIHLDRMPK